MTALAGHKVQEVVYAALKADTDLGALLKGIYDEPPTSAGYPYLAMGATNYRPSNLKDRDGATITFEITLWSNEPSQMEVKELMAFADKVLGKADLTVVGYDFVSMRLQSAGVMRQWSEDGSLYRGRLTYSALLYSKP